MDTMDSGAQKLTFGKHAGKSFAEVVGKDPGYCRWAQAQQKPSGPLEAFIRYIASSGTKSTSEAAPRADTCEALPVGAPLNRKRLSDDHSHEQPCKKNAGAAATPTSVTGESQISKAGEPQILQLKTEKRFFRLQRRYLELIKCGQKRWEGRLKVGAAANLQVGYRVILSCGSEEIERKVRSVREYRSFESMLRDIGVQALLPGCNDLQTAIAIYHSFPGYSEREKTLGVVAMELMPPNTPYSLGFALQ